ncbi:MAG: transglycosylase family protein [Ferrimicrobium acidiphilum]
MTGLLLALTLISPNTLVVPTMVSPMGVSELRAVNRLTIAPMPTPNTQAATKPVAPVTPIIPPKPMTLATEVTNTVTFATLPAPWKCIVRHESTYNLTAVNHKSGTEGAFQFDPATWQEFAPPSFPASPLQATLTQQFIVAKAVEAARGFGQWETAPLCGV